MGRHPQHCVLTRQPLLATAVTGKNMAQVWSLSTGEKVGVGMSHPGDYFGLWSVRFSPDGKQLATSHKDGRVRIFDWQSGEVIGSPLQHSDEVNDIAYTPDGRHLLASVRNGRLHVWDVATGKLAVPLSVNHRPDGGGAVCLAGSHAIVLDSIGILCLTCPHYFRPSKQMCRPSYCEPNWRRIRSCRSENSFRSSPMNGAHAGSSSWQRGSRLNSGRVVGKVA